MAKRKAKGEIKKPDVFVQAFNFTVQWAKGHLKLCLIGAIAICMIVSGITAIALYIKKQNEKAQLILAQAIVTFKEYETTGSDDVLKKAEELFSKAANEKRGQVTAIAKLYIGKIYTLKGKMEEAKRLYKEVMEESKDSTIRRLAESTLSQFDKK